MDGPHDMAESSRKIGKKQDLITQAFIKPGGNAQVQGAGESPGTLARVKGFDPAAWTSLDFRLWADMPEALEADTQCWELGYVALGSKSGETVHDLTAKV